MADEYQLGNGSWWDSNPSRNRLEAGTTPASSITTTLASFGWPTDMKSRSASGGGSLVLHGGDQSSTCTSDTVSAHQVDWNQSLLGEKSESSYPSMVEEEMIMSSNTKFSNVQQHQHWTHKLFSGPAAPSEEDDDDLKRGFSHFSLQAMSSAPPSYVGPSRPVINYPYPSPGGGGYAGTNAFLGSDAHFWPAGAMTDARSGFFAADQVPCFDGNLQKNTSQVRDLMSAPAATKKNSADDQVTTNKRPRNETPSPLPAFKVRKEKMGDRITALQQLVSPFGKTDTASVLSEAIEYIKFLHEQVSALSNPYMKNGAPIQHQQNYDKSRHDVEGLHRQDLRSRGLCLVPVSSTFPMGHETTVDFWTPTFGRSFR